MTGLQAIAFDLDGTLVDSAPDIAHALNAALASEGLEGFPAETVRAWVGDGPDATIARALGARADADRARRMRAVFDRVTLAEPFVHGRVYPGIAPLLDELAGTLPLVCITNKPTPLARAVLAAARLLPCLADVFGGDVPEWRKPAPALLLRAAERLGVPAGRMLMVGDGAQDVYAARAARCPMALVAWGYGHGAREAAAGDASIRQVRRPEELMNIQEGDAHVDRRSFDPDAVPDRGAAAPP